MAKKENQKLRILNADDDPMTRELIRAILESDGYDVVSAEDGLRVFELIDEGEDPNGLACIILDIEMPRMNGLDVLNKLKLESRTQSIPVIMLTAQSSNSDLVKSFNCGAEQYILKPFTRQQLLEGLKQVLEKYKD